jgi:hypothetical protein
VNSIFIRPPVFAATSFAYHSNGFVEDLEEVQIDAFHVVCAVADPMAAMNVAMATTIQLQAPVLIVIPLH